MSNGRRSPSGYVIGFALAIRHSLFVILSSFVIRYSSLVSYRHMNLFQSFWMAGFESACHINSKGVRLDMVAATQHDVQADTDYARLRELGLLTARDGLRWHLIDQAGKYDFSSLTQQVE